MGEVPVYVPEVVGVVTLAVDDRAGGTVAGLPSTGFPMDRPLEGSYVVVMSFRGRSGGRLGIPR